MQNASERKISITTHTVYSYCYGSLNADMPYVGMVHDAMAGA